MFELTEAAKRQIESELKEVGNLHVDPYVRVQMSVGWGGPQLRLSLEEKANRNDIVIQTDSFSTLIDPRQLPYFDNTKLDYTEGIMGFGEYKIIKK